MSQDSDLPQYPQLTLGNLLRLMTLSERPQGIPADRYDALRPAGTDKTRIATTSQRLENREPKSVVEAMLLGL